MRCVDVVSHQLEQATTPDEGKKKKKKVQQQRDRGSPHLFLSAGSLCTENVIHFVTLGFSTASLYVMPIKHRLRLSGGGGGGGGREREKEGKEEGGRDEIQDRGQLTVSGN